MNDNNDKEYEENPSDISLDNAVLATANDEISLLKEENSALQDKTLRLMAEMDNMKKRYERELDNARDLMTVKCMRDFLNVYDALLSALQYESKSNDDLMTQVIMGIKMTITEIESIFERFGIERIDATVGKKFNFNIHHAMEMITDSNLPSGVIAEELQSGYTMKGKLLRPAMVKVTT